MRRFLLLFPLPFLVIPIVLFACVKKPAPDTEGPPSAKVELIHPRPGQVIGGPGVLLLARSGFPPPTSFRPVFEYSEDGRVFLPIDGDPAPDYGPDSYAVRLDTTLFKSGPLFLRVINGKDMGGPIEVKVNHLPRVNCVVTGGNPWEVTVDCSKSLDPDGVITSYEWYFGEGKPEKTDGPMVSHTYTKPGVYDLEVGVYDDAGMFELWEQGISINKDGSVFLVLLADCGCEQMALFTGGMSALRDPLRPNAAGGFDTAPLGRDPDFPRVNFEIEVLLKPGSNVELCEEGQEVRRTFRVGAGAAQHKRACSAPPGRSLPTCTVNADCDTHTCNGGTMNGQNCDGLITTPGGQVGPKSMLCVLQGGTCDSNGDGVCTEYPFAGQARGNDDYREHFPGDEAVKLVCPGCGGPRWFDGVGLTRRAAAVDVSSDADFLAFVRGTDGSNCQCHFRLTIDWVTDADPNTPGNQPGHRPGGTSGITLVMDAETINCIELP